MRRGFRLLKRLQHLRARHCQRMLLILKLIQAVKHFRQSQQHIQNLKTKKRKKLLHHPLSAPQATSALVVKKALYLQRKFKMDLTQAEHLWGAVNFLYAGNLLGCSSKEYLILRKVDQPIAFKCNY